MTNPTHTSVLTPVAWLKTREGEVRWNAQVGIKLGDALFTAAQLQQAKAEGAVTALREAAEVFNDPKDSWIRNTLANMAAELEVGK